MTHRQARLFAVGCTLVAAVVFVLLTAHSHTRFPALTNAGNITAEVKAGMDVWHYNNCVNCHTLFGEGAYYAPDLTKITEHRSDAYLIAYMKDPSRFYDEQVHRRLMPKQDLSDADIANLVAFLDWVAKVDNQGWPPRPIRVVGSMAGAEMPATAPDSLGTTPADPDDDPRARGREVFRQAQPACRSCHSLQPGADMAGPTLAGLHTRAERIVDDAAYTGEATTAQGYIRESIVAPSRHIVAGGMYSAGGTSFMPATYGDSLSEQQISDLVAFLSTYE